MAPPAKRRKTQQVTELTFDPEARKEYLTGFHKRKVQRTKQAQEEAQKREREEKIKERRELREQRKIDLEKHVAEVNAALRAQEDDSDILGHGDAFAEGGEEADSEDEWNGIEETPAVDGTDEYVDEDKYTTVTIKELDDVRDFESGSEVDDGNAASVAARKAANGTGDTRPRAKSKKANPKQKKRKFRYETKVERQAERKKQKMKGSAAAKARKAQ